MTAFGVLLTVGQLIKDSVRLPRPLATPQTGIVRLERTYETEYGFPSTHSMCGLVPLALVCAWAGGRGEWWLTAVGWVVGWGGVYALSVGASRLYLGVHSLLDVVGGLVVGGVLLVILHCHRVFISHALYHPSSLVHMVAVLGAAGGLLWVYPRSVPWSVSYLTTCTVVGTWVGLTVSLWCVHVFDQRGVLVDMFRSWGAGVGEMVSERV